MVRSPISLLRLKSPTLWSQHPASEGARARTQMNRLLVFGFFFYLLMAATYAMVLPQFVIQLVCDADFPAGTDCSAHVVIDHATNKWVLVNTLYQGAGLLSAPAIGALADRYGRRPFLFLCIAVTVADNLALALVPSYDWLLVLHTLCGLAGGNLFVYLALAFALVSDIFADAFRGADGAHSDAFGSLEAVTFVASAIGPFAGGQLQAHVLGFRRTFALVAALLAGLLVVAPRLLPRVPPAARALGRGGAQGDGSTAGADAGSAGHGCARTAWGGVRGPFSPVGWLFVLGSRRVRTPALVLFVMWWPSKAIYALQNSYAKVRFDADAAAMGVYNMVLCVAGAVSSHYLIRLRGRRLPCACAWPWPWRRRGGGARGAATAPPSRAHAPRFASGTVLLVGALCGVASNAAWALAPTWTAFVGSSLLYGGAVVINPMFRGIIARASPPHMQARALGSVGAMEIFEQMLAPISARPLFNWLDQRGAPQGLYAAGGCFFALGALLVVLAFPLTQAWAEKEGQEGGKLGGRSEKGRVIGAEEHPPGDGRGVHEALLDEHERTLAESGEGDEAAPGGAGRMTRASF
eukprot:g4719.t1